MKTPILVSILAIAIIVTAHAVNTPLTLAGFNADLVIENTPTHFAQPADGIITDFARPTWFEAGLGGHSDGLPSSRTFSSVAGTVFQLEPYGANGTPANNALRMFDGATATLTLAVPVQLVSLSILAFTSSGTGSSTALPLTIHFTDSSTMPSTYSAPDWVAPANGIDFLGRSAVAGSGFTYAGGGNDFGMTETLINLTSSGTKLVQSITFTGANDFSGATTTSVMAVSGTVPEPAAAVLLVFGAAICLRRRSLCKPERGAIY